MWAGLVPWQIVTGTEHRVPMKASDPCPFTLRSDPGQCSAIIHMVASYTFGSLNVTSWPNAAQHLISDQGLPSLYRGLPGIPSSFELFAYEPPTKFGLITSDGFTSSFDWLPTTLLEPLPLAVWCLTAVSILVVSTALVGLERARIVHIMSMAGTVSRALIDQTVLPFRIEVGMSSWMRPGKSLVWTTWLLSALLITNCYTGVFQSNYVFEPEYSRNWTTLLNMGKRFRFYFGCLESTAQD